MRVCWMLVTVALVGCGGAGGGIEGDDGGTAAGPTTVTLTADPEVDARQTSYTTCDYAVDLALANSGASGQFRVWLTASGLPTSPNGATPAETIELGPYSIGQQSDLAVAEMLTGPSNASGCRYDTFAFTVESGRTSGAAYVETDAACVGRSCGG